MKLTHFSKRRMLLPVSVLVASLVLAACGSGTPNAVAGKKNIRTQNQGLGVKNSIDVTPQMSKGFAVNVKSIVLKGTSSSGGGYVAIASDVAGVPGQIIGYKKIAAGTSKNVKVTVAAKLATGNYFFLLYPSGVIPTHAETPLKKMVAKVTVN